MPEFRYVALARDGKEIQAREYANDTAALKQILKGRRLILIKAKEQSRARVSQLRTGQLISDLADLLDSGVALERGLQIISSDNPDPKLAALAVQLRDDLKGGHSLSQAIGRLGAVDPLVAPMIYAGEVSGQMPTILNRLSEHFSRQRELKREITSNLAYPAVLVVVCILSLIGLAVYVVPVFRELFEDDLGAIPVSARIVFSASQWALDYGGVSVIAALAIGALLTAVVRHNNHIQLFAHRAALSTPLVGGVLGLRETANLTSVLGVLLDSGVPLVQAMEVAQSVSLNRHFRAGMEDAIGMLRRGTPMSVAVRAVPALPPLALRLIVIGDESGRLGRTCTKAAGILEKDLRARIRSLVSLLEPVIILFMGGLTGFVVVSMLLAVYGLTDLIGG